MCGIQLFSLQNSSRKWPLKFWTVFWIPPGERGSEPWLPLSWPRHGVPWTQKFQIFSAENPELWIFVCLKPGMGQNVALHALPTARNFSSFRLHGSFNFISFCCNLMHVLKQTFMCDLMNCILLFWYRLTHVVSQTFTCDLVRPLQLRGRWLTCIMCA